VCEDDLDRAEGVERATVMNRKLDPASTRRGRGGGAVERLIWLVGGRDGASISLRLAPLPDRVLGDRERLLGGEHPDTLTLRANLPASS
jgi:hypothetical protein